jgi:hypothetical protein
LLDTATVKAVSSPQQLRTFLDVSSKFTEYSVSNTLLIATQKPEATRLKDFNHWKDLGLRVKGKEHGINIFVKGDEFNRKDGSTGNYYEPKKVFDISQTTARQRKEAAPKYLGRSVITALVEASDKKIETVDVLESGEKALFMPDKDVIVIEKGVGASDGCFALARELAQVEFYKSFTDYDRKDFDFHANAAAYILSKRADIATDGIELKIPEGLFANMEPKEIRAELDTAQQAALDIFADMEPHLEVERNTHQKSAHQRDER